MVGLVLVFGFSSGFFVRSLTSLSIRRRMYLRVPRATSSFHDARTETRIKPTYQSTYKIGKQQLVYAKARSKKEGNYLGNFWLVIGNW
jgi:hypothetical protein